MKTYSAKSADVTRTWYLIDAADAPLGRIATQAASLLIGKGKPSVTAHVDGGDFVVIINAANLKVTGDKVNKKIYYHHTHYPGGIKSAALSEKLSDDASEVLFKAVRGMLPVNKLRDGRLKRLKIYNSADHPHDPQQPKLLSLTKGEK